MLTYHFSLFRHWHLVQLRSTQCRAEHTAQQRKAAHNTIQIQRVMSSPRGAPGAQPLQKSGIWGFRGAPESLLQPCDVLKHSFKSAAFWAHLWSTRVLRAQRPFRNLCSYHLPTSLSSALLVPGSCWRGAAPSQSLACLTHVNAAAALICCRQAQARVQIRSALPKNGGAYGQTPIT